MVELDPAVHAAPAPMVEHDAAPTMAYRVYAALVPVVEYDAPAQTVAHQEHAAPAPVDEYDASAARAPPSPLVDGPIVKVVQTIEQIVDTPEIQTVQSTESLDTAPDLEIAPVERTLRIPLADCEGVIEELSKAMEEGLSAVLDEFIENFDKPAGLSAVIDEHFEKFDKPEKKHESDEYVCGTWAAEKGEVEYIASAAAGYAGPTPNEEKYCISMMRLEEESCAALAIQRGSRWTPQKESEEKLQEKLREVRRRLVTCLPVGASAKVKRESLRDMQSTLKAIEKDGRMILEEELANLKLDLGVRSGRVEW